MASMIERGMPSRCDGSVKISKHMQARAEIGIVAGLVQGIADILGMFRGQTLADDPQMGADTAHGSQKLAIAFLRHQTADHDDDGGVGWCAMLCANSFSFTEVRCGMKPCYVDAVADRLDNAGAA